MFVCECCGQHFERGKRGPEPRYCSPRCRTRDWRGQGPPATGTTCARCGVPIKLPRRRWCSLACAEIATGQRRAEPRPAPAPCAESGCDRLSTTRGLCGTHYNRTYYPDSHKRWPAKAETTRRNNHIKSGRRRAKVRHAAAENIERDVVGDRDGWRCGICRRRVNRKLTYPNPRSPSIDHVVALSDGGAHVYSNVRIAHLVCNVKRSNRVDDVQLALI